MSGLPIIIALLCCSWHAHALGHAIVINRCPFSVFLASVQATSPFVLELPPGDTYVETYRPVENGTGVSIKITSDICVGKTLTDVGRANAFASSSKTQLEYSYVPSQHPTDLYYDLSDINDEFPRQFCAYGVALHTSASDCPGVLCPSSCDDVCPNVYNDPNDNHATKGCRSSVDIALALCAYIRNP
ncbi:hypothetical protein X797_011750 [Metarhizium robertsii]|uniref:Uncharacterized protein n=1 Tax=Metarhizium robertsii TaxID=568076 RepID=A0A014QR64_9HYPO|nr:hypothetical protein X797_011750 [Metarhizium robertsii]